jgi:hypothetical protein
MYFSDDESGTATNELSRLIQSRKSELHTEVLNMIMGMLNKGLIEKNSKPIEASERNAKLIKAYLYRVVTDKNPQLTGMDKILIIKKMNDKEIIETLEKMPDLDDLEAIIQKHIEDKYKNKPQKSNSETNSETNSESEEKPKKKSSKKSKDDSEEKPKKKSSKKSKDDSEESD